MARREFRLSVFLVEPEGKGLAGYLASGVLPVEHDVVDTIADGIRVLKVGENCFPILQKACSDKVITVVRKYLVF